MTNDERKALIKKAAQAIRLAYAKEMYTGMGFEGAAEAALAVFEQAHTTTGDEREALEALLDRVFPVVAPFEKRNSPMRGDDAAVDRRDDERNAVSVFIDSLLEDVEARSALSRPVQAEAIDWSRYIENPVTGEVSLAPEVVAPIDEEREALLSEAERRWPRVVFQGDLGASAQAAFIAGAEWAFALRRPVQGTSTEHPAHSGHEYDKRLREVAAAQRPTPGDRDGMARARAILDDERKALAEVEQVLREGVRVDGDFETRWVEVTVESLRVLLAAFRRRVQAEPTDYWGEQRYADAAHAMQAEPTDEAWDRTMDNFREAGRELVAALRAAFQEGENRG